jgi:NitT/TauT family transport system permease protein
MQAASIRPQQIVHRAATLIRRMAPSRGRSTADRLSRRPGPRQGSGHPLARLISLAGFVLLWWAAARLAGKPQLLPAPQVVASFAWNQILSGAMPLNLGITLARVAAAFALSMLAGVLAGTIAGRSARADALIDPWLVIALNLPVLVVIVLVYIWVGLNELAAVLAVAIAKTPTVTVTVREGARALDPGLEELAQVFRLGRWRRLRRIVLPQLAPYLAAAARSGLSITWKIVLIVELLGRPNGVGFVLNLYFQDFNVAGILAYGFVFAAVMLLIETVLLQRWERRVNDWRRA